MAEQTYTPGTSGIYFDKEDFKYYRHTYDLVDVKYDATSKKLQQKKGSENSYTDIVDLTSAFSDSDTKNTAGSTNSTSDLFIIGATSQAANPQTYSNSKVKISGGTVKINTSSTSTASWNSVVTANQVGAAAAKDVDTSIALSTTSTNLPTSAAVASLVSSSIAAADAMIYKGTLGTGGTITELPNTTAKIGWTYKVITNGTYDGNVCEEGDMIICLTSGSSTKNATWTVVQNNIDGAVTGPVSATEGHLAVFGSNGRIIKDGGAVFSHPTGKSKTSGLYKITVDANGHVTDAASVVKDDITALGIPGQDNDTKVTSAANHYGYTANSAGDKTVATGTVSFNSSYVLTGVTVDDAGHVTGVKGGKLPAANNYSLPTASTSTKGGVKVGTGLTMSGEVLNHSNSVTGATVSDGGATRTLAFGGTFKIPSVTYDDQGHITSTSTITLTLPSNPNSDTKYTAGNQTTSSAIYLIGSTTTGSTANSYATTYTKSNITVGTDGHLRDSTTVGSAANTDLVAWRAMTTSEIDLICTI